MCIYQVITTTSMHCSYPHCTALSLLPFLLTGLSSSFHVPQTAHGSRTTTLNARTPTRELHARSLACLPKKPLSFQAPSYPRSPPQLGQGKANQSCPAALLHRHRNGTSPARARTKRTQASTAKQAGNLAINPTHAAKRGKQGKSLLVPISTPAYALHVCVCVCVCMRILHCRCCSPPLHTVLPGCSVALRTTKSSSSICRVPAHALRVQSGWPRWRELSHAPVRDNHRACLGATCD